MTENEHMKKLGLYAFCIYACQFFFGGWFLFHGLNFWTQFYIDPTIRPGPGLLPALASSGLLSIVKMLEVLISLALLADVFTPLAVIVAFPITIVIAYVNMMHLKPFGICVGIIIIALNSLMAIGHLDRYLPMLVAQAGPPSPSGISMLLGSKGSAAARGSLGLVVHVVAIVLGIAAATAVTFATVHP